jgi:hypothetical protein
VLTLRFVRSGIVPERFLPMQFEDVGGEKTTLAIGLAPVEINHHMDGTRRCRRWCYIRMCLCHLLFLIERPARRLNYTIVENLHKYNAVIRTIG